MSKKTPYYISNVLRQFEPALAAAYRRAGETMGALDPDYEYATILIATGSNPKYLFRIPKRIRKIVDEAQRRAELGALEIARSPLISLMYQCILAAEATEPGVPIENALIAKGNFDNLFQLSKLHYTGGWT